jgi:toxin ParE1/3/4
MKQIRLSQRAQADLAELLSTSSISFGVAARRRYASLIGAAFDDLAEASERPGSRAAPELGDGLRLYHIRNSRRRVATDPVRKPRHFILYRVVGEIVAVVRLLHDAMDFAAQLDRPVAPKGPPRQS